MSREISFRGRDINSGIWRIGHYVHDVCYPDSRATHRINGWEIDPNTVGEFTGLKDKNGVEVFEGDIVKFHYFGFNGSETDMNEEGEVLYRPDGMCFVIHSKGADFAVEETTHFEEPCIEVIGNKFDTPTP